jgi:hypothetical protein
MTNEVEHVTLLHKDAAYDNSSTIAEAIAAAEAASLAAIPAAGAVLYLDSDADDTIPNYQKWRRQSTFVSGTEATLTAALAANTNVQLGSGGNPIAFISLPSGIGAPAIQQGQWSTDLWLGVSNNNGTVHVETDIYKRTVGGVETLLDTIVSGAITGVGPTLYQVPKLENEFVVDPTDRVVMKVRGVKVGGSNTTTLTLTYKSSAHTSHVQTAVPQVLGGKAGSDIDMNGFSVVNFTSDRYKIIAVDVNLITTGNDVVTAYTLPTTPTGAGRWILTRVVPRVKVVPTGTGTPSNTFRVGSTSGGQEILLDFVCDSSNTVGQILAGQALLSLGSDMAAANGFEAVYAAAQAFYCKRTKGGTTVTGGAITLYFVFEGLP